MARGACENTCIEDAWRFTCSRATSQKPGWLSTLRSGTNATIDAIVALPSSTAWAAACWSASARSRISESSGRY